MRVAKLDWIRIPLKCCHCDVHIYNLWQTVSGHDYNGSRRVYKTIIKSPSKIKLRILGSCKQKPIGKWCGIPKFQCSAAQCTGRTYNGIKFTNLSCCIVAKFYAKRSLLYNGKILCQHCLAVTQGKLLCWNALHKIPLCRLCTENWV